MEKICVIGPCLKMGGMERASCNFANAFDDLGYEVVYIAMFKQPKFFELNPGITFIEPANFNVTNLSFGKTLQYLRQNVKAQKPDAVFVINKLYSAMALLALVLTKYKVFISERSSPLYKWPKKMDSFIHAIFKAIPPAGVVAQTSIAQKYQQKYHKRGMKFKVVPNALRKMTIPTVAKKNYVLAMGRFNDDNKGFDRLIAAFAKVSSTGWTLVFAGGDDDGSYLKDQARALGILDKTLFLGKVDVAAVLAESKIFVIPSRSEGFPNALCEAMAAGLACIAFDFVAGPRDIITHGVDGLIVEDDNIEAMASAIDGLIWDDAKRETLSRNALAIRERFDSEKIGRELSNFLLGK